MKLKFKIDERLLQSMEIGIVISSSKYIITSLRSSWVVEHKSNVPENPPRIILTAKDLFEEYEDIKDEYFSIDKW